MSITQTFDLNLIPEQAPVVVHCDQYDEGTGRLIIKLFEGDVAYTPTGTASIQGRKPDGHGFQYSATLVGNTVTADLTFQMSCVSGRVRCQVVVTESTGRTGTFAFILDVQPSALPSDTDLSDSDYQLIEQALEAAEDAVEAAEDAEAWAVGERGGVPVDPSDETYHNNAEYWAGQAAIYAQGALRFQGSIPFASIPTTGQVGGDMYNITDDFTTDARFIEGSGKFCPAGTNIAWVAASSKWDVLSIMKIGSLDDLTDVSITSPLSGDDYLGYDPIGQEFKNKKLTEMSNLTKGIGRPDGKTTDVSLGVFSAIGVNIPAEVNSGGTPYGANWLYYAGTTETITPDADQNYRVTDNGTTKLYFWNGSSYEELTSGGGGGTGDYMGLYGMTEIQSSDGQGTTEIDLSQYTNVGNYYCHGKAEVYIGYRGIINDTSSLSMYRQSNAEFILYVRRLPNDSIIQDIYLYDTTGTPRAVQFRRLATFSGGTYTFEDWFINVYSGAGSRGAVVGLSKSIWDVNISNGVSNGEILVHNGTYYRWENKPIGEATGLASINTKGATNTTGATITAGTYFYLDGVLVRAKTNIANGASYTLNTNYEVVTAGALNDIRVKLRASHTNSGSETRNQMLDAIYSAVNSAYQNDSGTLDKAYLAVTYTNSPNNTHYIFKFYGYENGGIYHFGNTTGSPTQYVFRDLCIKSANSSFVSSYVFNNAYPTVAEYNTGTDFQKIELFY